MSTSVYRVDSCLLSTAVYHVSTVVYPVDSRHYTPQLRVDGFIPTLPPRPPLAARCSWPLACPAAVPNLPGLRKEADLMLSRAYKKTAKVNERAAVCKQKERARCSMPTSRRCRTVRAAGRGCFRG